MQDREEPQAAQDKFAPIVVGSRGTRIIGARPALGLAVLATIAASHSVTRFVDPFDDPFWRLDRRNLTREEARAALRANDEDKRRMAAADAKRARKAAKLRRQAK